ncbi:uncharacterized protein CCOS01_13066 [Colletotrichum costaricense]|uniref:Uncharacterized protein n=1 Tax=Colletotrichum costaricense TaxID=1209916 RepID=A0AAI9YMH3_9PEZI|nr:uncharacterized protein CCOS01_13066 [Colletotrichum costaricense]KAK1515868.1 hypothetical protein CCOS01_13066 [Colletotrichum costaricense]
MGASMGPIVSASASPHPSPLLEPRDAQRTNENGQGQVGAFLWPQRFFTRQSISRNWENSPYITAILKNTNVPLTLEEPGEEDNIFFLRTEENWAADKYRVAPLIAFLRGATITELQHGDIKDVRGNGNTAIIIDGNISHGKGRFRPYLGSLSPLRLLEELRAKRYNENPTTAEEDGFIDAERRLIYIVDLSRWSVLALVGSAPESLYRLLDDFLLNYVLSRSSIGVHFSTEGPETFALEFSLPYSVWRTSKTLMHDHRSIDSDRKHLRFSEDVTFLRTLSGYRADVEEVDAIYSSHISCIVTGYDQSRWTCILLCEAWFEVEIIGLPTPDSIARYEAELQDVEESMGVVKLSDPMCRGKGDMSSSTATLWLPRSYFLRVMEIRLSQIHKEWMGVFDNIEKQINGITERHQNLLREIRTLARDIQATPALINALDVLDDFEAGILRAEKIVKGLSQKMEDVVSSGDSFMTTDVNYFLNTEGRIGDAPDCMPHLSQIRWIFNKLRKLRRRLGGLETSCEEMIKGCSTSRKETLLRIELNRAVAPPPPASTIAAVVAPKQSLAVGAASWMTITSQPLVNIAAVFSCDNIIGYDRTPRNFVISLVWMYLGMAALVLICMELSNGRWIRSIRAYISTSSHEETNTTPRQIKRSPTLTMKLMDWWQGSGFTERPPFRTTISQVPPPTARIELTVLNSLGAPDCNEQHDCPGEVGPIVPGAVHLRAGP